MMTLMCSCRHQAIRLVSNALFGCFNFDIHVGISNAHVLIAYEKGFHVSLLNDALITDCFSECFLYFQNFLDSSLSWLMQSGTMLNFSYFLQIRVAINVVLLRHTGLYFLSV